MPWTFATYAVGMLALSGFPLIFSGFWSKDEILHAAHGWSTPVPFYLGLLAALLTAFYMTRQVCYVFLGSARSSRREETHISAAPLVKSEPPHVGCYEAHESPPVMIIPLLVLAAFAVLLGFIGTPAWPWFQGFLSGENVTGHLGILFEPQVLGLMALSSVIVIAGLGLGWWLYGRLPVRTSDQPDPLDRLQPEIFALLRGKYFVDEVYKATVIRLNAWGSRACDWLDYWVWNGVVQLLSLLVVGLAWLTRSLDEFVVNPGFDEGCRRLTKGGTFMSRLQGGRVQTYLRLIGVALVVLVLFLIWGCRTS
jgi:NADH-quinone oxidoreductase subunit L